MCFLGLSKGVGFIRFDQRQEAERAIKTLNGTIPDGATEPITVKFANAPSSNKNAIPITAVTPYLSPTRRFLGPIHHAAAGRFRYVEAQNLGYRLVHHYLSSDVHLFVRQTPSIKETLVIFGNFSQVTKHIVVMHCVFDYFFVYKQKRLLVKSF